MYTKYIFLNDSQLANNMIISYKIVKHAFKTKDFISVIASQSTKK